MTCDWCREPYDEPGLCDVGHCLADVVECRRCADMLADEEDYELGRWAV